MYIRNLVLAHARKYILLFFGVFLKNCTFENISLSRCKIEQFYSGTILTYFGALNAMGKEFDLTLCFYRDIEVTKLSLGEFAPRPEYCDFAESG